MKIRRILLILTTLVFIFAAFSFFSLAQEQKNIHRIRDDADYITGEEESALEQKIASAEEKCDTDFRIFIYNYSENPVRYDIDRYEHEAAESFNDLILLVISYEYGEYYYELFTKGEPNDAIRDSDVDKILDNDDVYDNIKSGNLYEGVDAFVTLAEKAMLGLPLNTIGSVIVPALIIALVVASVVAICIIVKYRKKLHSTSYPLDKYARLDLNVATDDFINKSLTRVKVNTSSGSSSGGRGISFGGSRGRR